MRVLVTGGTGYIGAHVVRLLRERGDHVVVVDDVVTGLVERIGDVPLLRLDLSTDAAPDLVRAALTEHDIDAVIHFAGRKQVGESVDRAAWYYRQNVGGLANVLSAMQAADVTRIVFSSSAAVYAPSPQPIREEDPCRPANPYGETKLAGEWLTAAAARSFGARAISLRYFNVAGAGWPELGDRAALNLIPMVLQHLERGERPRIFGGDYDTPDGTCIRDYVHVLDVAEAHLASLDALSSADAGHRVFNVGTGTGSTVLDTISRVLALAGSDLLPEIRERRPGDAPIVIASADRIADELGWVARFGLDEILRSSWESHQRFASEPTA